MSLLHILLLNAVITCQQDICYNSASNYLEKVYIHTDRPKYTIGDQLFDKAYVTDENLLLNEVKSKVQYVELITPDRNHKPMTELHYIGTQKRPKYN